MSVYHKDNSKACHWQNGIEGRGPDSIFQFSLKVIKKPNGCCCCNPKKKNKTREKSHLTGEQRRENTKQEQHWQHLPTHLVDNKNQQSTVAVFSSSPLLTHTYSPRSIVLLPRKTHSQTSGTRAHFALNQTLGPRVGPASSSSSSARTHFN